jgi:hypothetical protein
MTLASWQAPMETVCSRLDAALEIAFPGEDFTVTRDPTTGRLTFTCTSPMTIVMSAGWAAWAGFASTTYGPALSISGDADPEYQLTGQLIGLTLPVQFWHRGVPGGRQSVVWDGPFLAFDLLWTRYRNQALIWDPQRVPFVLYQGDLALWSLSNRDGWLLLRPLPESSQWELHARSDGHWNRRTVRALWIDGVI